SPLSHRADNVHRKILASIGQFSWALSANRAPPCHSCVIDQRAERLLDEATAGRVWLEEGRYAVARDAEIATLLKRLDHPMVAVEYGRIDPAASIINNRMDLATEWLHASLNLGLDALDIAIALDRELPEVDE